MLIFNDALFRHFSKGKTGFLKYLQEALSKSTLVIYTGKRYPSDKPVTDRKYKFVVMPLQGGFKIVDNKIVMGKVQSAIARHNGELTWFRIYIDKDTWMTGDVGKKSTCCIQIIDPFVVKDSYFYLHTLTIDFNMYFM
jgi:hypothetical protein